ncbi:hypothetical protein NET02_16350 [Thermomicrobiaceae bacterium CFH 74404]|uniref:Uncharacterized protein n=1 Tax=Thermalbibacter longus TaxID=2951981 RepID=A0AA41WCK6_9BACT|nr:hypothetical protein [Thermalbibacter longus]MCM8750709.1 hypothetical protein [Thermalbibacter longus]
MRLASLQPPRCRRCGALVSAGEALCYRCREGLRLLLIATAEPAVSQGVTVEQLVERLHSAVLGYLGWENVR